MPAASDALLQVEFSQSLVPMMLLTDSGDRTKFNSGIKYWSGARGFEPVILPNGIRTGGDITATGVDNQINVSEVEANLNGVVHTEPSGNLTVTRPAITKVNISSVTLTAALALAVITGTDGDTFSETRAATGGPPLIPVGSIELGQVRLNSDTAAAIVDSEIKQTPGTHRELAGYPVEDLDPYFGTVTFSAALPAIHTGAVPKQIYAEFYTPEFIKVDDGDAFQPPQETFSLTSTTTYDGARGSSSSALNAGSFTALLKDGIVDPVMKKVGDTLWIRFYPKKTITGRFWVVQGILGVTAQYPAAANINGTFSITSEQKAVAVGG